MARTTPRYPESGFCETSDNQCENNCAAIKDGRAAGQFERVSAYSNRVLQAPEDRNSNQRDEKAAAPDV